MNIRRGFGGGVTAVTAVRVGPVGHESVTSQAATSIQQQARHQRHCCCTGRAFEPKRREKTVRLKSGRSKNHGVICDCCVMAAFICADRHHMLASTW